MPTYEYVCRSCGDGFEVTQAFTDSALTTCEACGGPLRKVYGSIGIVFKGGGFYKTENRSSRSATAPVSSGPSADKTVADTPESIPPSKKDTVTKDSGGSASTGATKTGATKPAAKS